MYCSTCGSPIASGRTECEGCGTRVRHATGPAARPAYPGALHDGALAPLQVGRCFRCGYSGEGVSYFSRGGHVAGLVGITVLTAGLMGAGGLVYYFAFRDHRICPRCGQGWGKHGERSLVPVHVPGRSRAPVGAAGEAAFPEREGSKRGWSILLFVMAFFLLAVGIAELELVPAIVGMAAAGGGALLYRAARTEREERRAALISRLQLPVLRLAAEQDGRLTVTEVAAHLGWTLSRAEKVLESLEDGMRVSSEVTDAGVIVYEFRELLRIPDPPRRELPRLEDRASLEDVTSLEERTGADGRSEVEERAEREDPTGA